MFRTRHRLAGRHRVDDLVAELEHVGRLDRVVLHHVQRIVAQHLMQLGERAPGAADGAEACRRLAACSSVEFLQPRSRQRCAPWPASCLLSSCSRMTPSSWVSPIESCPSSIAESSRLPPPRSPTMPEKSGNAGDDAERREMRLFLAAQHPHLGAHDLLRRRRRRPCELLASRTADVARICDLPDPHQPRHEREALDRGQRPLDVLVGELAGLRRRRGPARRPTSRCRAASARARGAHRRRDAPSSSRYRAPRRAWRP